MNPEQLQKARQHALSIGDFESVYKIDQQLAQMPQEPEQGLWDKFKGAVKGDAAEDLPNVNEAGMSSFKTGAASMFGGDEDYANALKEQGYQIDQDENGNLVAIDPQTGQRAYVNQPGLDMEDVVRGTGKALSFIPAARFGGMATTTAGRVIGTGAGMGVTDAAMQKGAGRDYIDPEQVAVNAGLGAAAEVAAPLVTKGARAVMGKFRGNTPSLERGRQELMRAGATPEDIAALPEDVIERVSLQQHVSPEVRWQARVAEAEGYMPTRAQQTDDALEWRKHEQGMEATGGELANAQTEAVQRQGERLASSISGARSAAEAEAAAGQSVRQAGRDAKAQAHRAYRRARDAGGELDARSMDDLAARMQSLRQKEGMNDLSMHQTTSPQSVTAMNQINDVVAQAKQVMSQPNVSAASIDFRQVEQLRRNILNGRSGALNPNDRRIMGQLSQQFDRWIDNAIDQGLFSGDPSFVPKIKEARSLWRRYKNNFDKRKAGDQVGVAVQKIVSGEADPATAVGQFIGLKHVSPVKANEFLTRVWQTSPQAGQAVKESVVRHLLTRAGKNGEPWSERALYNNLRSLTQPDGEYNRFLWKYFTPAEQKAIKAYEAGVAGLLRLKPYSRQAGKSSGTAERLMSFFGSSGNTIARAVPVLQGVHRGILQRQMEQYPQYGLILKPALQEWDQYLATGQELARAAGPALTAQ